MSENAPATENLSIRQEKFILAYLSLPTLGAAARAAGVNEKTAARWLREAHVDAAIRRARREFYTASMQKLADLIDDAIDVLRKVIHDRKATYGVKLRAAEMILSHAHQAIVDEDIEARLMLVEEAMRLDA